MKIYLLLDDPYHDNNMIFGAYSSQEKAQEAWDRFEVDPSNNWSPDKILELELDAPASISAVCLLP